MAGLEENEVASRNESSSRNKNGKGYCSGSFIGSVLEKFMEINVISTPGSRHVLTRVRERYC